jgi:UDP-galactopyranose mutase
MFDFIIIGAGITGLTIARCLHDRSKAKVAVIERDRVGGLCHDSMQRGIRCTSFGPHIVHTNSVKAWTFLNRFSEFTNYRHHAASCIGGRYYDFPPNVILRKEIGDNQFNELKAAMFLGYSKKQWGDYSVPDEVLARIVNHDSSDSTDYFDDKFQGMPRQGYRFLFDNMCEDIALITRDVSYADSAPQCGKLILTGSLDEYYAYAYGRLPYSHIIFNDIYFPSDKPLLPCGHVNYPESSRLEIRACEHRHYYNYPIELDGTMITLEYATDCPTEHTMPCYPIVWEREIYNRYAERAGYDGLILAGRLAEHKYYNIDDAVLRGMQCAEEILK